MKNFYDKERELSSVAIEMEKKGFSFEKKNIDLQSLIKNMEL